MTETATQQDGTARGWRWWRRAASVVLVGLLMFLAAALVWVWTLWDPPTNGHLRVATYFISIMIGMLVIAWMLLFSGWRLSVKLAVTVLLVLAGSGFAASVRSVQFDGDMNVGVTFRWEKTREQVRQERLPKAAGAAAIADDETAPQATADDLPAYRGRDRTGVISGPPLRQDWESHPPDMLWEYPSGEGYAGFAIVDRFAVTQDQRGDEETVVCLDVSSGAEMWAHGYPRRFTEFMGGDGPRSTPTIYDGRVYSLGAAGDFLCLDLLTGDVLWQDNVLERFELQPPEWGLCSAPLIIDDQVIINAGGRDGNGLVSYDRASGDVLWHGPCQTGGKNKAGYSSPMLVELAGRDQILMFDGAGLRGHDPASGETLWFYPFENDPNVNVAQPLLFDGDRVFLSASYGSGCVMLEVRPPEASGKKWPVPAELWSNRNMRCKFTSPAAKEGFIYGLDEGILTCLDANSGERAWKKGRYGHGQLLLVNGQLLILSESGDLVLAAADPEAFREIGSLHVLDGSKTWNPPAISRGIALVRNHEQMAGLDLRAVESAETVVGERVDPAE